MAAALAAIGLGGAAGGAAGAGLASTGAAGAAGAGAAGAGAGLAGAAGTAGAMGAGGAGLGAALPVATGGAGGAGGAGLLGGATSSLGPAIGGTPPGMFSNFASDFIGGMQNTPVQELISQYQTGNFNMPRLIGSRLAQTNPQALNALRGGQSLQRGQQLEEGPVELIQRFITSMLGEKHPGTLGSPTTIDKSGRFGGL